jgi:MotA/TolQ/ExbB proton channel family
MLANNFLSHHLEGDIKFMAPLTTLLAVNLLLFAYILLKKKYDSTLTDVYKHIGILILMYGVVGTLTGFLQMFDALEAMTETLPLSVISGGVKVALLNVFYGVAYFCICQVGYVTIKLLQAKKAGL